MSLVHFSTALKVILDKKSTTFFLLVTCVGLYDFIDFALPLLFNTDRTNLRRTRCCHDCMQEETWYYRYLIQHAGTQSLRKTMLHFQYCFLYKTFFFIIFHVNFAKQDTLVKLVI